MMANRRMGGWTDGAVLTVLLLSAYPPIHVSAQVSFHVAAGVRYSSTLVHDSIAASISS